MAEKSAQNLRAENQRLNAEVEELRMRLEEAEQALEAIRTGQVESLIVEGPSGPRIYSLEGADHSYRVLVEAMNEGAATFGEDGTILYCNARFAEMVDVPLEGVMGSAIQRFLPARSRDAFQALLREADGGESRGELDLRGPDDKPVPALVSVSVIHDETRRRFCLVTADLRAQKRNEEILAAERLAGSVLEQAADAIVVCDDDGRILRVSSSAATLCACNPLFRPFEQAFPLSLSNQPEAGPRGLLTRAMRGENVRTLPASMTLPDGNQADLLVSAVALHDPKERLLGYVVTIVNVTELREGEKLLRESERRYKSLAENVPAVLMRYGPDLRVLYLSPSSEQVTGRPSSAFIGKTDREMGMPEQLCDLWENAISEVFQSNASREIEFTYPDCDRHFLLKLVPEYGPDRRVETVLGISTDITERKRVEEELRAANLKLAEADQRKNQFLAVLSHELRNPLAPIKNSLYVLERAAPGGNQARRAQDVIDRQTGQLARLVDDLLDVTRITRNKVQLQRQRLELNELVRRTMDDYRSQFDQNGITLEMRPAAMPVYVHADWNRIAQVIGNLLQNAAKFTGRAGTTRVAVETDQAARLAIIRVTDTGVGMPPELLSRLFEPFSQADETLDRSKGGLGLGLALVKGLVELHGGQVEARSEGLGKGAEFIVRLPLEVPQADQPEPARQEAGHNCRRVLIIEDNVDAANSLSEALGLGCHEVVVAHNGPDGIAKTRKFRPEVVLCDIGLPGMDGYQVARAFRSDVALRDVYLVALTGYALPDDLQQAQQAGFQRHLAKPPSLEKLERLLANVPAPG